MSNFTLNPENNLLNTPEMQALVDRANELTTARTRLLEQQSSVRTPMKADVMQSVYGESTTTIDSLAEMVKQQGAGAKNLAALADRLNAQSEALNANDGFVSKDALNSTNPFVRFPAMAAEATVGLVAGANNVFNNATSYPAYQYANILESEVPEEVRREFENGLIKQAEVKKLNESLSKLQNNQPLEEDIPFKTVEEIQQRIKELEVTPRERALMDARNPKTGKSYRDTLSEARYFREEANAMRGKDPRGNNLPTAPSNWTNNEDMVFIQEKISTDKEVMRIINDTELTVPERQGALMARSLKIAGAYALKNPSMIAQEIAKSAIYMLMPGTASAGYGLGLAQDLENSFRQEYKRAPTAEERLKMHAWSGAAAGANMLSNVSLVKSLSLLPKATTEAASNIAAASGRSFGAAALATAGSAAKVGLAAAKPVAVEGSEELFQAAVETGLGYGKTPDAIQMGIGAAIGGLSGGAIGSVPSAISQTRTEIGQTPRGIAKKQAQANQAALDAIPTQELSDYTSTNYNPVEAVKRLSTELSNTKDKDAQSIIVGSIETTIADLQTVITALEGDIKRIPKATSELDTVLEMIEAERQKNLASNPESADAINAQYDGFVTKWEGLSKLNLEEETKKLETLKSVYLATQKTAEPVLKNKPKSDENQSDYDKVILGFPTDENVEKAVKLSEDLSLNLTDEQRTNLRLFTDAVAATNELKTSEATKEFINEGGTDKANQKFFGLSDYVKEINQAIRNGDTTTQKILSSRIAKFRESQSKKAAVVAQAFKQVSGDTALLVSKVGNEWQITRELPLKEALKLRSELAKNGTLIISPSYSRNLVPKIIKDAQNVNSIADYIASVTATKSSNNTEQEADAFIFNNASSNAPVSQPVQQTNSVATNIQEELFAPSESDLTGEALDASFDAAFTNETVPQPEESNEVEKGFPSRAEQEDYANARATTLYISKEAAERVMKRGNLDDSYTVVEENGKFLIRAKKDLPASVKTEEKKVEEVKPKPEEKPVNKPVTKTETKDVITNIRPILPNDLLNENVPFTDKESAKAHITENKLGKTHKVVKTGSKGYVVRERDFTNGELNLFNTETDKDTDRETVKADYRKGNLINAFFTQKLKKGLNSISDFVNTLGDSIYESALEFLDQESLTPEQIKAIKALRKMHSIVEKNLSSSIVVSPSEDFRWKSYLQYMLNQKTEGGVELDQNVYTAIAASMITWSVENGSAWLEAEQLATMFGDSMASMNVTPALLFKYSQLGMLQTTVINQIGSKVYEVLGFKLDEDADTVHKSRLQEALGSAALHVLIAEGFVESQSISRMEYLDDRESVTGVPAPLSANGQVYFVRVSEKGTDLNSTQTGAKNIVSKLLGVPNRVRMPSKKPITEVTQSSLDNLNTALPTELVDRISKMQQVPYQFDESLLKLYQNIYSKKPEILYQMFGFKAVTEEMKQQKHITEIDEIIAKNEGIIRSVTNMFDTAAEMVKEDGTHSQFYLPLEAWSIGRVGVTSTALNEQGDKIHRSVYAPVSQTIEIDLKDRYIDPQGNITGYGRYLLALGSLMEKAPLSVAKTPDKTDAAKYLPSILEYLATPEVQEAVDAILRIEANTATGKDVKLVTETVNKWGMEALSVQALLSYAKLREAEQNGDSTFTAVIGFESDGVNNGVVLSELLYGTASMELLNAGGIYQEGDIQSITQYKANSKNKDYYEQLGEAIKNLMLAVLNTKGKPSAQLLERIGYDSTEKRSYFFFELLKQNLLPAQQLDPEFGERKGAKTIAVPFNYGAKIVSISNKITSDVINNFYKKIAKANSNGNTAEIQNLVKTLNNLLETKIGVIDDPNSFLLSNKQIKELRKTILYSRGTLVKAALNEKAESLIAAREDLIDIAGKGATYYNAMRNTLIEARYKEMFDAKELPGYTATTGKNAGKYFATQNLPDAEIAKIDEMLAPYDSRIVSALGSMSRNPNESAHPTYSSTKKERVEGDSVATHEVSDHKYVYSPKNVKTYRTYLREEERTARGVGISAAVIQNVDASVSTKVSADLSTTNHHDANTSNVLAASEMGVAQNSTLVDVMKNYHVGLEIVEAIIKPLEGLIAFDMKEAINHFGFNIVKSIVKSNKGKPATVEQVTEYLMFQYGRVIGRDLAKLEILESVKHINQYGTEQGHYDISEKDLSDFNAQKKVIVERKALVEKRVAKIAEAIIANQNVNSKTVATEIVEATALNEESTATELVNPLPEQSNNDLFKTGVVNDTNGITAILQNLAKGSKNAFEVKLIKLLTKALPTDVTLVFEAGRINESAGSYDVKAKKISININNRNFGKPEIILHEIVHAITASALRQNNAVSEQLVKDLADIRKQMKAKVDKSKLSKDALTLFNAAIKSNDELLAVAFSSQEIRDAMNSVPVIHKGILQSVYDVFKRSVGKFFGLSETEANLLDRFINVGGLAVEYGAKLNSVGSVSETLNYPTEEAADAVGDYTALEVFNSLQGKLDSQFEADLANTMTLVVDRSYDVLQAYGLIGGKEFNPDTVWIKAVQAGKAAYTGSLTALGFKMTDKEIFAVETIEAAIKAAINNGFTTPVYREIRKAYDAAKKELTVENFHNGDWNKATQEEKDIALNKYNALFGGLGSTTTANDYIARFIALGLGSQEMSGLLKFKTTKPINNNGESFSLFNTVVNYVNSVMDWINGYLTKTLNSDSVNDKLSILAKQLIEIDQNARSDSFSYFEEKLEAAQDYANEVGKVVSEKSAKALEPLTKIKPDIISAPVKVTQKVLQGKFEEMAKTVSDWRNAEYPNSLLGWAGEALVEALTPETVNKYINRMTRKYGIVQETRQRIIEEMVKNINGSFKDELTSEDRKAVTKVFIKNTSYNLLDAYGITGIATFISDKVKLNQEIAKLTTELMQLDLGGLMLVRAKDLAYYQVKGEGKSGLVKNTDAIAAHVGTAKFNENYSPQTVELLNKLVTLYSYKYSDQKMLDKAYVIISQNSGSMESVMKFQKSLDIESKNNLFRGNIFSMVQGYMPEIADTHKEIRVATTKEDAANLERLGFTKAYEMKVDPLDTGSNIDGKRFIYVARESSRERYVSGAMALNVSVSSGTSLFTELREPKQRFLAVSKASRETEKLLANKAKNAMTYDPSKHGNSPIPRYRQDGTVKDFVYEMGNGLKEELLNTDTDFANLMGHYAGSTFDKVNAPKHNNVIMEILHKDYVDNFAKDPSAFITISNDSADPRLIELYRTIPKENRDFATQLYGKPEFVVRNTIVTPTFGYEKYSVGKAFERSSEMRNAVEKLYVGIAEMFLPNARIKLLRADRAWTETVTFIKDVIVIRNLTTLVGNQIANMGILSVLGVSPIKIVSRSLFAIKAGLQYRRDMAMKTMLQQRIAANVGNIADQLSQLSRVEDSMNRNPLKEFIAEGLLPSYVEDLEISNDQFSYKSRLSNYLDSRTQFIADPVKEAGKYLLVSPTTPLYKFLSNATQFSDFTAKFVLYEHLTTRAKNPMNKDSALDAADTMFINYGVPTSKFLQALNDRGFIMFTKYYIRIQRAILFMLKEHPTSAVAQTLLASYAGVAGALTPSMFLNLGNPFGLGALNLPSVLGEPIPMKLILGD